MSFWKVVSFFFFSALGIFLPFFLFAQKDSSFKVGVVDIQRILVESRSGRSARDVLQKSHERKVKELEQKRQELEELQKKYTTQKDLLNEKSRREMEQKIMDLSREYQELQLRAQMDIQKLDQELTQNILEELQPIVKKIAEEKGFDLILEKNEGGVVFRKEPLDITDLVLKQYDQSKEGDSSPRKK